MNDTKITNSLEDTASANVVYSSEVVDALRKENAALKAKLKAAIKDMRSIFILDSDLCRICKHDDGRGDTKFYEPETLPERCKGCYYDFSKASGFEWRRAEAKKK